MVNATTLGGPYNGYSPKQTINNYKDSNSVIMRRELVKSWNTEYATGVVAGRSRIITPFRAVTNSGDFLARINYVCGGSNPSHLSRGGIHQRFGSIVSKCDGTGVPASATNGRFVADASDYTKYKRQSAYNKNYNDLSNGGYNNASYVNLMAVRR